MPYVSYFCINAILDYRIGYPIIYSIYMFTFSIFKLLIKILYSGINVNKNYLENDVLNNCVSDSTNNYSYS
jgi:hypothetical protein